MVAANQEHRAPFFSPSFFIPHFPHIPLSLFKQNDWPWGYKADESMGRKTVGLSGDAITEAKAACKVLL